ncbi:AraC family transcriptional regulator [Thalassotalea sediminis]|uniref:AraC family transcriptional regulator n=1 Tax=Thalassotalea sediminis TaxID=1759089 RepID=UPI0025722F4D|nr:GyrI-like domain-containing protein [Thalassotalea sediminis]
MNKFIQKLQLLVNYINENLSEPLSLVQLSKHVGISQFHLHRLFSTYVNQPLRQYIQHKRLERAAYQIYFREYDITDIAFNAGYQSLEAFSRAFKQIFTQSPRDYRKQPILKPWLNKKERDQKVEQMIYNQNFDVTITNFKQTLIATYRHQGNPENLMASVQHFIQWRRAHHTPPSKSKTFNLLFSDPNETEPAEFIFDIGAETKSKISDAEYKIFTQVIPQMRCAKLTYQGADQGMSEALNYLYGHWLANSSEEVADFPCIIERVTMYPDVPKHQATMYIYLPLK